MSLSPYLTEIDQGGVSCSKLHPKLTAELAPGQAEPQCPFLSNVGPSLLCLSIREPRGAKNVEVFQKVQWGASGEVCPLAGKVTGF